MNNEPKSFNNYAEDRVSLESALQDIMTFEQYREIRHPTPYIYDLEANGKELKYFGTRHIKHDTKPDDPALSQIKEAFDEMKPDCVFVEGIHGETGAIKERVKGYSYQDIIGRAGEAGFFLKLAVDNGVDWQCPEPSHQEIYEHLLGMGFSREEIFAHDILLSLPQYLRGQQHRDGFEKYSQGYIDHFKTVTGWEDFDYSYNHGVEIIEQILGRPLDVENQAGASEKYFVNLTKPMESEDKRTILTQIGEETSMFRDRKIVSNIAKALETYDRVFVVYGASHAVKQEPALRTLFALEENTWD